MARYGFYKEMTDIIMKSNPDMRLSEVMTLMEDVESPITNKYIENLYNQVIKKAHIDFDSIPRSAGNIRSYSGYNVMVDTLSNMRNLAQADSRNKNIMDAIVTVETAINSIDNFHEYYERAYREKCNTLILEYNLFVYCCVEATTSILSEFVEVIKDFGGGYKIQLKNTRYRANAFYVSELARFNNIVSSTNYKNYLASVLPLKDNFVGATAIGIGAVAIPVILGIVPLTRSLIYQFFRLRTKLSDALALQAYYLELNKSCVEANQTFDAKKKESILKKQAAVQVLFMKLSYVIKVNNVNAQREAQAERMKDDSTLKISDMKNQVDNSSYNDILL